MTASGRSVASEKSTEAKAKRRDALETLKRFHSKLCHTRVFDPACGTGNFLYVSLEMMKQLENEVIEAVEGLGSQEGLAWLDQETVGPSQFLGIEKNPRAAAIAELVVWLGYLQLHYGSKTAHPPEPILDDFGNIECRDAVLDWDGDGNPKLPHLEVVNGEVVESYPNSRKPDWPEADFIVGNPPFIGGKDVRDRLGDAYSAALWKVHKDINDSADFVMYWWDRAAIELTRKNTPLQRFGLVTTNSITQVFSRRVVARHLEAKKPISILMAIPNHPWTKATDKAAAVRIAMTIATAGAHDGTLREVIGESKLDTDQPSIEFDTSLGYINSNLSIGPNIASAQDMVANLGLASRGVALHGAGFIVTPNEAELLGLGKRKGLNQHIRQYRHGRDLTTRPRGVMVIDLDGLSSDDVRSRFPKVYQHLLERVKPERDRNNEPYRRNNWWLFGRKNTLLRPMISGLKRYIVTVETMKHRVFQFLNGEILPDNTLVAIGSDDAFYLGVLSSELHVIWSLRAGGWLGVGNDPRYSKSRCFDPFPFPDCPEELKDQIRAAAEELDAHRKARQEEHPSLTLTQMYNVLEKLRAGKELTDTEEQIKSDGLILILKELHDKLDAKVLEAYGWTDSPTDEVVLERLVSLNAERVAEEARGDIKWLRREYQVPRFGSDAEKSRLEAERKKLRPTQGALDLQDDLREMMPTKPAFPTNDELAETAAVMKVFAEANTSLSVEDICRQFRQGRQVERRINNITAALARLGHLNVGEGESFSLRR